MRRSAGSVSRTTGCPVFSPERPGGECCGTARRDAWPRHGITAALAIRAAVSAPRPGNRILDVVGCPLYAGATSDAARQVAAQPPRLPNVRRYRQSIRRAPDDSERRAGTRSSHVDHVHQGGNHRARHGPQGARAMVYSCAAGISRKSPYACTAASRAWCSAFVSRSNSSILMTAVPFSTLRFHVPVI
jgi:hypothetical protein